MSDFFTSINTGEGAPGFTAPSAPTPTPTTPTTRASSVGPPSDPVDDVDWEEVSTVEQWKDVVRERFPAFAWALDHPEIGPVLEAAAEGEFTEGTFDAQLRDTDWWRTRTEAQRAWDIFAGDDTNETELQRRIDEAAGELRDMAGTMGADLSDDQITSMATSWLRNGLSEDELRGEIISSTESFSAGSFLASETGIKATAADFLVTVDDETVRSMAAKLATGEMTPDGVAEYMRHVAKQQYPSLGGLIDQGINLREYSAPHRKMVADMLGKTVDQVDLTTEYRDILSIGDSAGPRPMTLSETERYVRSKDEYWAGDAGKAEVHSITNGLTKALGVRR